MLTCPRCGRENADGTRLCTGCAEPLTADVVASGEALRAAQRAGRLKESTAEPNLETRWPEGSDRAYVRWEGIPFAPFGTIEQSYGQFVLTSICTMVVIFIVAGSLVYAGQALCGALLALVLVGVWYVTWRVGAS